MLLIRARRTRPVIVSCESQGAADDIDLPGRHNPCTGGGTDVQVAEKPLNRLPGLGGDRGRGMTSGPRIDVPPAERRIDLWSVCRSIAAARGPAGLLAA